MKRYVDLLGAAAAVAAPTTAPAADVALATVHPVKALTPAEKEKLKAELIKFATHSVVPGLATGVLGAVFWKKHRVLGFLGGSAVGTSAYTLATGNKILGYGRARAVANLGMVGASVGGSLIWKKHPILGYIAGGFVGSIATSPFLLYSEVTKESK
jgi:hypothetical protein